MGNDRQKGRDNLNYTGSLIEKRRGFIGRTDGDGSRHGYTNIAKYPTTPRPISPP